MKALPRNVLIVLASTLVTLVIAEIGVRVVGFPIGARTESLSPWGPRYVPDSPFVLEDEHYLRGRINNLGFHDRMFAFDIPAGTYRVGFFGDSATEARQVEVDSTFANVFEDLANARGDPVDCAAFGLIGSGADQELFRCLHAMQQARFDEVVYVFYRNDFLDGFIEKEKPPTWPFLKQDAAGAYYFSGAYQPDRSSAGAVRSGMKSILKDLYLPGFVSYRLSLLKMRQRLQAGWQAAASKDSLNSLFALGDSLPVAQRPAQTHWKEVVRYWKRACDSNGVRFTILYIPPPTEVEDSTYAAVPVEHKVPRHGLARWIGSFCEEEGIRFLDPTPAFVQAQVGTGRELYWSHLNYKGHRVLGAFLHEAFRRVRAGSDRQG